jgi:hypothetical protein
MKNSSTKEFQIMTHCDEVVGLALSERLGGTEGYKLLLADGLLRVLCLYRL